MSARRGMAMLLVLLTTVVIVVGVTIIARMRTDRVLAGQQAIQSAYAMQIIRESDQVIRSWLDEVSTPVVLSPESEAPHVAVLDDTIETGSEQIRIRIDAWDQLGMWPRTSAELGLNPPIDVDGDFQDFPNLDQINAQGMTFPGRNSTTLIGGILSTHNPWPARSGQTRTRSAAAINMNTAPMALLSQVSHRFHTGDLDQAMQQRAQGKMVTMSQSLQSTGGTSLRLVGVSSVWSFRIDVRVGNLLRSCWCVYANRGGHWAIMQRIMVDEAEN